MEPTERDEIAEFRLAAVRPVLDVMPIDVVLVGAARESGSLGRVS